ncbi:MAG: hypothetical protein LC754_06555 [Acidobacteria bacterium]|nr:hypothetical protein [Acidobacteriota bacterium]
MKTRTKIFAASLALALSIPLTAVASTTLAGAADAGAQQQQEQLGALERGYRTGYSDGYQAGWSDAIRRAAADYRNNADYQRADRAYIQAYGTLEDYRDGYQQGFEIGYNAGYSRRGFDSNVPAVGLKRRGATAANDGTGSSVRSDEQTGSESTSGVRDNTGGAGSTANASGSASRVVPSGTVLKVELLSRLSTDISQRGDHFEARVIEPREYEGAVVAGHVSNLQRPGKARGRAQLQLAFEQIRMPGGDWTDFSALLIEVLNRGGDDNAGDVDPEGGVRGKDSTKDDVAKVGASAGVGAIIGAIAGGGRGAAIGAVIGGSAGGAGVMTQRGKDIRLDAGQQLRIRSTGR